MLVYQRVCGQETWDIQLDRISNGLWLIIPQFFGGQENQENHPNNHQAGETPEHDAHRPYRDFSKNDGCIPQ